MMKSPAAPLFVTILLTLPAFAATNEIFSVTGSTYTSAGTINDNGDTVGCYQTVSGGLCHGFLRTSDGTITTFDVPGATSTGPSSVNDSRAMAGLWLDPTNITHAFAVSSVGEITTFDPPGASQTYSAWINSSGVIAGAYPSGPVPVVVGYIRAADGTYTTFTAPPNYTLDSVDGINANGDVTGRVNNIVLYVRHSDGTFDLKRIPYVNGIVPKSLNVDVRGLNATDEVVGTIFKETGFPNTISVHQPFVWAGGTIATFAEESRGTSGAAALNDNGDVVGWENSGATAFLRSSSGQLTSFTVGSVSTFPSAINNSGVICGSTVTSSGGPTQGFVRLP